MTCWRLNMAGVASQAGILHLSTTAKHLRSKCPVYHQELLENTIGMYLAICKRKHLSCVGLGISVLYFHTIFIDGDFNNVNKAQHAFHDSKALCFSATMTCSQAQLQNYILWRSCQSCLPLLCFMVRRAQWWCISASGEDLFLWLLSSTCVLKALGPSDVWGLF